MPANAGVTHSPRQYRPRTFRNLKERTSPVTPPPRHNPHHHLLPPDNARNHPTIAIVLKRIVLLFWRTQAASSAGPSSPRSSQLFPIVLGPDGANADPAFRQRPAVDAGVAPWPLGRPDPRRVCWRCTVSPFFSRS
jgi:hypothetical protein